MIPLHDIERPGLPPFTGWARTGNRVQHYLRHAQPDDTNMRRWYAHLSPEEFRRRMSPANGWVPVHVTEPICNTPTRVYWITTKARVAHRPEYPRCTRCQKTLDQ